MKLIVVNSEELKKGTEKEMREHHMSEDEARKTAIEHLLENPEYYSIADSVGLEEEDLQEHVLKSGRLKGLKQKVKKIEKRTGKKAYWFASA